MPNRNQGPYIPHAKLRGEWAELRFQLRAAEHGLILAKPCGDNAPYDFAVDHQGHFLRVQVKCTVFHRGNSYKCHLDHNGTPYTPNEIDFFAAYVIPPDVFYILPLAATNNQPDILLTPHRQKSKYAQYKEAWNLLMSAR
jgi:PD-(D/E)XK endonuclease